MLLNSPVLREEALNWGNAGDDDGAHLSGSMEPAPLGLKSHARLFRAELAPDRGSHMMFQDLGEPDGFTA
ncbi:MAG: hypothetical protein CMJ57_02465 [Planctomycetaceae bacterium]|nr:hypothetical protein [Planctomycetaceae bacterium]